MRKFTVLIIFVIKNKEKARFSEIVESVPNASNNIISKRLKFLQKANIVYRDQENLTYSLTNKGNEVYTKLRDILLTLS
ncbi:winged helix-turn-helix transcriptional regulator [Caldiplasma sukawensis]